MSRKLYIVGIGPGGEDHLTPAARRAIEVAEVVTGYRTYLDLIDPLIVGKSVISSGMRQEVDRCREALALAASGKTVALVCSGDPGIYGMAGLVLELAEEDTRGEGSAPLQDPEIEIVPGVSAVQAAAARLGAPLMHDFAVISLSDLLTPWPLIRRRLEAAADSDFVVALYNPKSRGRTTQFPEAREILLRRRHRATPVGIVRNACRSGEAVTITTLEACGEAEIDMFSLVIVGNSSTFVDRKGRMVTPRGYDIRTQESGVRSQEESPDPRRWTLEPGTPNLEAPRGRAIFVGGTGSDVGKSVIAAGLCRILRRRGLSVAPFKAQNMALNSAVTPEGGEIGRAQALQAAACGIPPHTDMNPILLKPNSDTGSQVIVQGRPVGNMTVREYHRYKAEAWPKVCRSFRRLAAEYEAVVLEGAGSIAEINLREHDLANLRVAAMAGAPVLLVADIDRGGVFASIVGTLELLTPEERSRVAGVVINKFRGDPALLASGIEAVEKRTGVSVLGVIPWLRLRLPEEDSLGLDRKGSVPRTAVPLRIGVLRLPRISNFTDFDPLEAEPDVELLYLDRPGSLEGLDLLLLPGTKSTLDDLHFLREEGFIPAIREYCRGGGRLGGICGGYQMLGTRVADPHRVESERGEVEGLGVLDVETVMHPCKQTHQAEGIPLAAAVEGGFSGLSRVSGYEIHMGETVLGPRARPLWQITRRSGAPVSVEDGAVSPDGRIWGTYLHGLFEDCATRQALLGHLRSGRGTAVREAGPRPTLEGELDRLADHLEQHMDLEKLFRTAGLVHPREAV